MLQSTGLGNYNTTLKQLSWSRDGSKSFINIVHLNYFYDISIIIIIVFILLTNIYLFIYGLKIYLDGKDQSYVRKRTLDE